MSVEKEDIDEINEREGIRCTMSGANTFYQSGALTLRKSGKNFRHEKSENPLMHSNSLVIALSCVFNPTLHVRQRYCARVTSVIS